MHLRIAKKRNRPAAIYALGRLYPPPSGADNNGTSSNSNPLISSLNFQKLLKLLHVKPALLNSHQAVTAASSSIVM
jgi:hypothetical protein